MKTEANLNSGSIEAAGGWCKIAGATAVVAAAFSLLIIVVITVDYLQGVLIDTRLEKNLETLRVKLRLEPDSEPLLSQTRDLDLRIRRNRIGRLDRSRKGGYLLLGSIAALLIGVKWHDALRKKPPSPHVDPDPGPRQIRQARLTRRALAAGVGVVGIGGLLLALGSQDYLGRADKAARSYPSSEEIAENWPRFRGPGGAGISAYTNIPDKWDGKTGQGILWKTRVPLPGFNSPVVWGNRIFLSGADPNERHVYCFDAPSGQLLWTGNVAPAPPGELEYEEGEDTGTAAPTMTTDGRRVYAIFADGAVACFDFEGKPVWTKNLGIPDISYGYASSLEMYRNLLLIQYDQGAAEDQKSRVLAFNGFSGQLVWQAQRPVPNSWTSPIVVKVEEQYQLIACGEPWVISYDPANGAELWRAECLGGELAPSPIFAAGLVLVIEPYTQLVAIRPDGRGDVTETHIAWRNDEGAPDICCPVSNGELIFMLTTEGLLTCNKTADGTKLWEQDFRVYCRASPSLAGDRLYVLSEKGVMIIIEAAAQYKELARCELGEDCHASPAFADGRIYIRAVENLYCIGQR